MSDTINGTQTANVVLGAEAHELAMMSLYNGNRIDFRKYRSFETLPREAWEQIDDTLIRTAKENLVGIADLNANPATNMTYDGMSSSVYTRKRISEIGAATVSVTPDTTSDSAILAMDDLSVPMMVTYKDFNINTNQMAMAARIGMPLGFALVEEATRSVTRTLENNLFNGILTANGATAYGYFTYPSRQRYLLGGGDTPPGKSWAAIDSDPDQILADINMMMSLSMQANHFGPWMLYIPWQYQTRLNQDYVVGTYNTGFPVSGSIRSRLMELPGLIGIRVSNYVPNDNVALVEMTSDTVMLINGMPLRALAWEPPGTPNWDHKFKVMTISMPMMISDYKGQCGIIHGDLVYDPTP